VSAFLVNFHFVRKVRLVILLLGIVGIVVAATFFIIGRFRPKVGGILIETNPSALILINGEEVGRTPYEDKRNPGEVILKLIPESFETPLAPYETRVDIVTGVLTVIKRDFGEFEETSGGEIISFEKIAKNETSLVVVSIPDSAQLSIDGHQRAITPHKASNIEAGDHTLQLSANGYMDRFVPVKTHRGYKLTAIVQLVSTGQIFGETVEEEEVVEEEERIQETEPQVEILSTSVGFLRVRSEPSTLGKEISRVKPGEVYELVDTDEKTGWFKIEYLPAQAGEEGKTGWISNQYAKKLSENEDVTPTDAPATLTPKEKA
jgi:hypothetical protein